MRGKMKIFFLGSILLCLFSLTAITQAEEQKAKLYFLEEMVVKPCMISEHEAAIKEMVNYSAEHNYSYPWYAMSDDAFHYHYIIPLKSMADIDDVFKTWDELAGKVGDEKWQPMMKKYLQTFEYYKTCIVRHRPDLSYSPESPRLKSEEEKFVRWGFCRVKPDKQEEFEGVMKEWVALYKGKNIPDGFSTFMGYVGTEVPFYFWVESGKSAADFYTQGDKNMEILGEEAMTLWKKTASLIKKFRSLHTLYREELSYIPKK